MSAKRTHSRPLWVLAGDMASRAGLAIGNTRVGYVASLTKTVSTAKTKSRGAKVLAMATTVAEFAAFYVDAVDLAVYEHPTIHERNPHALAQYSMITAFILGAYHVNYRELTGVWPSSLKKFATGHGGADKQAMCVAASAFAGHAINDHDEADAVLLLKYGLDQLTTGNGVRKR